MRRIHFTTATYPVYVHEHAALDLEAGNFQTKGEEDIYEPDETIIALAAVDSDVWRIVQLPYDGGLTYEVCEDSDANLTYETWNLTGLGPTSAMTSAYRPNATGSGGEHYFFARNGAEVWQSDAIANGWSIVASLTGSGTSGWAGLAIAADPVGGLRLFFRGSIVGGGSGLVEQRWPNALASDAEAPVLVFAGGDAVPIGVAEDGCALYATRQGASALELLIYRR